MKTLGLAASVLAVITGCALAGAEHGRAVDQKDAVTSPADSAKVADFDILPTLATATAEEGYALAVKLSRMAVRLTQPNATVRERLRPAYEGDADALIAISGVVASNFATVAAVNDHWRDTP